MILVEYACSACAHRQETWAGQEIPAVTTCAACGGRARRKFGGTLLGAAPVQETSTAHSHGTPGSCVLAPTAARMLEARVRGDRRAIDRETARQEKAISEGTLNPHRPPVLGQPR